MSKKIIPSFALISFLILCIFSQCKTSRKAASNGDAPVSSQQSNSSAPDKKNLNGKWKFDHFTMMNTDKKVLFPTQTPELTFDVQKNKFSGNAGCNSISGNITLAGNELTFAQPMIMTEMTCNALGEQKFVNYLKAIRSYNINDDKLELIIDAKPAMVFRRAGK